MYKILRHICENLLLSTIITILSSLFILNAFQVSLKLSKLSQYYFDWISLDQKVAWECRLC